MSDWEESATDSVFYRILRAIRETIVTHMDLSALGNCASISRDAVVFRPAAYGVGNNEVLPGIVISYGAAVQVDSSAGTNNQDDIGYYVLLQVIDRQHSRYDEDKTRSYLAWGERLRKLFNHQNLQNLVFDSRGYVDLSLVENMKVMDEQGFKVSGMCIQAVPVKVISRESRNTAGSE